MEIKRPTIFPKCSSCTPAQDLSNRVTGVFDITTAITKIAISCQPHERTDDLQAEMSVTAKGIATDSSRVSSSDSQTVICPGK